MGADWVAAKLLAPAEDYDGQHWAVYLQEHPDTFHSILGDVYRIYKSEEKKSKGLADPRGGRRSSVINGNSEELFAILEPKLSLLPFAPALHLARAGRSLRQVSRRAGMNSGRLSQLLAGTVPLNREELERLARALDVHPAYFCEWRTMVIQQAFSQAFALSPNLTITAIRALTANTVTPTTVVAP